MRFTTAIEGRSSKTPVGDHSQRMMEGVRTVNRALPSADTTTALAFATGL
jgi:hypothetical protein